MSAPRSVQGGEYTLNKQLISVVSGFPTEFCTAVLKSILKEGDGAARRRPDSRRDAGATLTCDFFQELLIDVEVRVDVLHVVMIFERFHQANHRTRSRAFEFDVVLRNHRNAG